MWSGVEKAARTFFSSTHPSWQAKDSSCHQFLWPYECPNGGERAGDHRSSLFSQPHFFWPTKCEASSGIVRKSPVLKIYFDRKRVLGKPTEGPKFTLYCMRMPERLCDAEVHDLRKSMILQTWRLPISDTNAAGMQSERAACTWGTHWTTDRPLFEVVHPFWSCESGQWLPLETTSQHIWFENSWFEWPLDGHVWGRWGVWVRIPGVNFLLATMTVLNSWYVCVLFRR